MRDTREIQTEPVQAGKKTESEAGVEFRRNHFQPVALAELAGVGGGSRPIVARANMEVIMDGGALDSD